MDNIDTLCVVRGIFYVILRNSCGIYQSSCTPAGSSAVKPTRLRGYLIVETLLC